MFFKVIHRSAARLHEILLTATIRLDKDILSKNHSLIRSSATQEFFAKTDAGEILNRLVNAIYTCYHRPKGV